MTDININVDGEVDANDPVDQKKKKPSAWQRIRGSRITLSVFAVLLCLTPLLTTRLAALATETSKLSSHYLSDSGNYPPYTIVLICTLLLPFLSFIIIDKTTLEKEHVIPRLSNIFPACGAAISAYLFFYFSTAENIFEGENKWAGYISLCAGAASAFFILKIFGNKAFPKLAAGLRVLTAIGVFALCTLIIISLYLDYSTELNSHFKLAVQFGAVGVMLGTMADARSALGNVTVRRYIAFKSIALTLTSVCTALIITRMFDEIDAYKMENCITSLSVDDLVIHFQSSPTVCASYVVSSIFFATYAACIVCEIIFAAITVRKGNP